VLSRSGFEEDLAVELAVESAVAMLEQALIPTCHLARLGCGWSSLLDFGYCMEFGG